MSGTEAQIIDIMREQITVEQETLDRLVRLEEEAKETVVRLAFMELRLDTWKHIKFLEGMIEHLTSTPCDEWSAKVARYSAPIAATSWVQPRRTPVRARPRRRAKPARGAARPSS